MTSSEAGRAARGPLRACAGVAAALGVALGLGACASSGPRLNLAKAEPALAKTVASTPGWYEGLEVGKVRCPSSVERQKDLEALCTVQVAGQPVELRVVQVDGKGRVAPRKAQVVLSEQEAEALVRRKYRDIGSVSCGSRPYIVQRVGETFSCDVQSNINGRKAKVMIRTESLDGTVKITGNT